VITVDDRSAFTEFPVQDGESVKNMMQLTHLYRAKAASLKEFRAQVREQIATLQFSLTLSDDEIRQVFRDFGLEGKK